MAKQAEENRALMERLGQMDIDLQERESAIKYREEEMLQLQELLKEKDDNLSRLKSSVASALLGFKGCLLYTSPSPRDKRQSRMPSSA